MSDAVYLTLVVPVRNEEGHIRATLKAMARQDYPKGRYEILVVDGRSTDRTRSAVEQFIRERPDVHVRLLDNPAQWSSAARNIGVRAADGRLIAVIDAHVHISNDRLFSSMERLKEEHGAMCLARPAPLVVPGLEKGTALWIALARKSWAAHSRSSYIYSDIEGFCDPVSSGFAYDRRVFDQVGYFDEGFDAAEDVEFNHRLKRAGIRAYTSPALTIYSYPRETLRGLMRQMVRYGVGRARFLRKHPEALTKETLIPSGVLLLSAALPAALLCTGSLPLLAWLCIATLVLYWVLLLSIGAPLAWRHGRLKAAFLVALAIWTTHIGLGWGFLSSVLLPRRRLFRASCRLRPMDAPTFSATQTGRS